MTSFVTLAYKTAKNSQKKTYTATPDMSYIISDLCLSFSEAIEQ